MTAPLPPKIRLDRPSRSRLVPVMFTTALRSIRHSFSVVLSALVAGLLVCAAEPAPQPDGGLPLPVTLTAQQDQLRLRGLLQITALRPGANGNSAQATRPSTLRALRAA